MLQVVCTSSVIRTFNSTFIIITTRRSEVSFNNATIIVPSPNLQRYKSIKVICGMTRIHLDAAADKSLPAN